ncbi:MAG: hypothetical protein LH473_06175, partial [Chitinophagales bacterium]|nr:hypothetical protein [Chitinophagales bacterium]
SVTLTATDTSGCSYLTSDDVVILVDAIDDSHLSFDISLFPNPANGLSTLEYSLPNAAVVTVELWNGIGQKMEAIISNQTQLAGKYSYQ